MVQHVKTIGGTIVGLCALMIAAHLLNLLLGGALYSFGLEPRDLDGADGILFAPLLHGDWSHLGSNLGAFVVLSALSLIDGIKRYFKASAIIIIVGGALLWLFGRGGVHVGASGWIFGLWAMVIAQAWYDRRWRNIAIAAAVLFYYGSMALGFLPLQTGVSFEGHVFGAIAGIFAARVLARPPAIEARPAERSGELKFWPDGKG
jgi:membrane associated rhomboid family serine protease